MYDVPGSGKHHRRPGGNGKHVKYHRPCLSRSDKIWLAGLGGYVILMTQLGGYGRVFLTAAAFTAFFWRLCHHGGDRYIDGVNPTPQEQKEFRRITGEMPVIEPTAVYSEPVPQPPVSVAMQSPGRPSWMPQMLAVGGAILLAGLAEASQHRVEQARRIEADTDALLGIPGQWNNYQPTQPSHGTRGWGPAPQIPSYSRVDLQKRQQAALMGYDRDRFSGANREKWEQYFR